MFRISPNEITPPPSKRPCLNHVEIQPPVNEIQMLNLEEQPDNMQLRLQKMYRSEPLDTDRRCIPVKIQKENYYLDSPNSLYANKLAENLDLNISQKTLVYTDKSKAKINAYIPPSKSPWSLPEKPFRVLEGNMKDDFYANNLDYKGSYILAGCCNYIGIINRPKNTRKYYKSPDDSDFSSVKFNPNKSLFACGDRAGKVAFVDMTGIKVIHQVFNEAETRREKTVYCMGWQSENEISLGSESWISHADKRSDQFTKKGFQCTDTVCSLQWSSDGKFLASGCNDNTVRIFDSRSLDKPLYQYKHKAAVKALQWKGDSSLQLLSGGGTADRTVKLFNTHMQKVVWQSPELDSQITSLISLDERHFVLGLGFPSQNTSMKTNGHLTICRYLPSEPSPEKNFQVVSGATQCSGERILNIAKDPFSLNMCATSMASNALMGKVGFWKLENSSLKESNSNSKHNPFDPFDPRNGIR